MFGAIEENVISFLDVKYICQEKALEIHVSRGNLLNLLNSCKVPFKMPGLYKTRKYSGTVTNLLDHLENTWKLMWCGCLNWNKN